LSQLNSFISAQYRPDVKGGRLDENHISPFTLSRSSKNKLMERTSLVLCFGPKKDKVLLNMEHAVLQEEQILFLYYEDIHQRWSFVQTNEEMYFLFKKNEHITYKIKKSRLYIRGCQIDSSDPCWMRLGNFYNFVDMWPEKVVCAPQQQYYNESKLFQLSSSIKHACKNKKSISIGNSYVYKGSAPLQYFTKGKSYIVKSLSGIRSIVVDEQDYWKWDKNALKNLPVLFQEKKMGNDLRIHVVNKQLYGKISIHKEKVDYRYDSHFSALEDYQNISDELKQFCLEVSNYEQNNLVGIDFIKTAEGYVVLEANPSPGWSAYYECNGINNNAFVTDVLSELKGE